MNEIKYLTPEEFRQMQLLQVDMLKELDRVCRVNNIKYSISDGTLLGAVRHHGYIPWDDDADVSMLREEYEKFKKVAYQLNPEICFFQDHDTDPEYNWGYGKLRRTGTKFVRVGQEHLKCKTGVFIDVFPLDDIPKSTIGQIFNDFYDFVIRKFMYAEVGKMNMSISPFLRFVYKQMAKVDIDKVFNKYDKLTKKSNNTSDNRVRILTYPAPGTQCNKNPLNTRYGMPKKWFLDVVEYDFEGIKLYGSKDYDEALTYMYGDYMQLPPEKDREPHAPTSDYSF